MIVLAALVGMLAARYRVAHPGGAAPWLMYTDFAVGALGCLALCWRLRFPVALTAALAVLSVFAETVTGPLLVALFTVAVHRPTGSPSRSSPPRFWPSAGSSPYDRSRPSPWHGCWPSASPATASRWPGAWSCGAGASSSPPYGSAPQQPRSRHNCEPSRGQGAAGQRRDRQRPAGLPRLRRDLHLRALARARPHRSAPRRAPPSGCITRPRTTSIGAPPAGGVMNAPSRKRRS